MYKYLFACSPVIAYVASALVASAAPANSAIVVQPGSMHTQAPGRFRPFHPTADKYTFTTIRNMTDPMWNQLLGINNAGTICGYYGVGTPGHPNKGYCVTPPYTHANFVNVNYPGSVQTQVVAIDNIGNTAGFWIDGANTNFGFVEWNQVFTSYRNPMTRKGTVNQLLGLNDKGIAVGFYTGGKDANHGYELNQNTGKFTAIVPPGGTNVTAAGIDNAGDVTGFYTGTGSPAIGFLLRNGAYSAFSFPNSQLTQASGMNNKDQIVGNYADSNPSGGLHGFVLTHPLHNPQWTSIDEPNAVPGQTLVNGINDLGQIVGYYTDKAGFVAGFLATPST